MCIVCLYIRSKITVRISLFTMAYYTPSASEIHFIEQIETADSDPTLNPVRRALLLENMWAGLEDAHGARIINLTSPEAAIISRPRTLDADKFGTAAIRKRM